MLLTADRPGGLPGWLGCLVPSVPGRPLALARYLQTLRRKALIYDAPEKPVEISGPDAVPFLETVLARRIHTLKTGRGRYAIACTPQGGVFMDGVLFKLADDRYWYVQADGPLET